MKEQIALDIDYPIIKNHKVYNQELLPGLAYIDMIYQMFRENGYNYANLELKNLAIFNPLIVGQSYSILLSIECTERKQGQWQIRVEGQKQYNEKLELDKTLYITAEMHQREHIFFDEALDIGQIKKAAEQTISLDDIYDEYRSRELVHTDFMKASGTIYNIDSGIVIDISIGRHALPSAAGFMFHPTLIDGCGIGAGVLFGVMDKGKKQLYLPLFYESFRAVALFQEKCITRIQASSVWRNKELIHATMEFFDQSGKKIAELRNFIGKLVRDTNQINPTHKKVEQLDKKNCQVVPPVFSINTSVNALGSNNNSIAESGIESFLRQLMAEHLHKPIDQIEAQVGYYDMGLDSSSLLGIVQAIENKINESLSPTLLFEYTTIAELSAYLSENYASKFDLDGFEVENVNKELLINKNEMVNSATKMQETIQTPVTYSAQTEHEIESPLVLNMSNVPLVASNDDIAIIGMAGRYPKARNLSEFWANLQAGRDCISEVPKSRWDWRDFKGLKSPSGKSMSKWGGFIDHPEYFDSQFFRISPREAELMDPQERLFLEVCWETIEDAGYTPKTLVKAKGLNKRRHVGVFAGVMHKDYTIIGSEAISKGQPFPLPLNNAPIANRISYFCNFHGPSIAIDTLCSSSLTAVHLAIESIKIGESEVALAGGVNLSLHPYKYLTYGMMDMHSSDGYCHTFGKDGNGYVSGEGVGAVLLKPLNKAIQDQDHIYAVIKGSTINHGGAASGITVPNPVAQSDMLVECLEKTKINPRTISYVEAHGTGTSLGDPIELEGLMKAFLSYTQDKQFCSIGSVKSNIGHTESAAGISGLHKIVLQLYYKMLTPSLHSEELNPYINFEQSPFYVQHNTERWKQPMGIIDGKNASYPRRASLSSFGAYGSNANIILEEFVPKETKKYCQASFNTKNGYEIIPLSAKNEERLKAYSRSLLKFLKGSSAVVKSELSRKEILSRLQERLEAKVRKILSEIIHVDEGEIANEQEWNEFGVDFVHIAKIKEKIQDKFKINTLELDLNSSIVSVVFNLINNHQNDLEIKNLISKITEQEKIKDMEINQNDKKINLSELSYTLQVGREAMEERVAFLVKDIPELIEKLEDFNKDKPVIENCWRGQAKSNKDIINFLNSDQDSLELIYKWIKKGNVKKITEFWTKGLTFDWNKLYGETKPQRISLPTYPFAMERYWVPEIETGNSLSAMTTNGGASVHPLVQQNTSDFAEQRYSSVFTGKEFFLTDHLIKGKQVLPGVAYLEMARAAVEQATGVLVDEQCRMKLKNVAWIRPAVVAGQSVQLHIGLFPEESGNIIYEIYSELEDTDAKPVLYSQGSAVLSEALEIPVLNLSELKAQCTKSSLTASECYEIFQTMGIEYGPGHQGLETVYIGSNQVLAKLFLPSAVSDTQNQFILHPSLMDAALQASIGLMISDGMKSIKPALPFALEELEIFSKCTSSMWAVVQYSEGSKTGKVQKLDIDLCDDQGNICIRIKGLSTRVLEGEVGSTSNGTLMFEPYWREQAAVQECENFNYVRHLVILCEQGEISKEIIENRVKGAECRILQSEYKNIEERFQMYAVQIFEEIQNIIKDKSTSKVLLQLVISLENEQQLFEGFSGLLRTAQLENPKFSGQIIEVEPREDIESIIKKLKENSHHPNDNLIRYHNDKIWIKGWRELDTSKKIEKVPWKDGGVYLITGGVGALGMIFAEEIARKVKEAVLVLTGRSLINEDKKNKLKELEALGARIAYKQIDVTQKEAVNDLIQSIRDEYGYLNGIIHSAGIIRDNFIFKKTKKEVQAVLSPKVTGLVNLDHATKDMPLDFFIFFSSGAGAIGNVGQADYSTANAFMDSYAKYRNNLVAAKKRQGRTLSINWPLWKNGGMQGGPGTEQMLMQRMGMAAMRTSTGISALYQSIASGKDQVMVVEGELKRIRAALLGQPSSGKRIYTSDSDEEKKSEPIIEQDLLREKAETYFKKQLSSIIKLPVNRIEAAAQLEDYGIDSIMVMQLTTQLENTFGSLSKTLFFEYQTIKELTGYFLKTRLKELTDILKIEETTNEVNVKTQDTKPRVKDKSDFSSCRRPRFCSLTSHCSEEKKAITDIAIIGVSGRYPQAKNIEEYWKNLKNGKDCITEIPKDRWDYGLYFDEDKSKPGKTYSKWGGFLDSVDQFDPLFFNISPREAEFMDPQERLFLECVQETLEDAGYTREMLSSYQKNGLIGNVGVYVGVMYEEYQLYGAQEQIQGRPIALTGNPSSIANRVSYFYNLHGPSMSVDTMCSSSLTSIHLACQSLQSGGCEMAIAGGVNVSIHPNKYLLLAQGKFVSSKGRCESFGQGGDGYVPGEGVGAVLLKSLAQAIADGDHIYGIIKGTAVNHGGKTNGYTVPNPNAQANVIGQTIRKAGIDPRTISYIEAHGTGTSLGDPIEIAGLVKIFEEYTQDKKFCAIGSAKSNIGHCESAAGIAGVTKILLQLKYKQLAPSLHSKVLNPNINFDETPFVVQQELTEWKRPVVESNEESKEYPRIAGISAFGAGGSNAHILIEEYISDGQVQSQIIVNSKNPAVILLSAKNEERLKEQAQLVLTAIRKKQFDDASLANMAYTLQVGREAMEERIGLIVGSISELEEKLQWFVSGKDDVDNLYRGQVRRNKDMMAIFTADEEMQEAIVKWIERKKYAKILELWVKGLNFDWNKLYDKSKPQRISLPVYPFAKERYWVPKIQEYYAKSLVTALLSTNDSHPLLQKNTSNFLKQRFSSSFTGQEPFLACDAENGMRIFPGVAFLEMARAAVTQAAEILEDGKTRVQLDNIVWAKPVIIGDRPIEVNIELFSEDTGKIAYEIYSESKDGTELVVYSKGNVNLSAKTEVPTIDIAAIKARYCQYDLKIQGIDQTYKGAGQILAKISLPDMSDHMVLDPILLDFVLQTSIGLVMDTNDSQSSNSATPIKVVLPFALKEIEIYGKLTSDMWILIQYNDNGKNGSKVEEIDIDLLDKQGRVCMRMRKLETRLLNWKVEQEDCSRQRTKSILKKQWELYSCMQTRYLNRTIAILASQETKELALQLAQTIPKSEVLDIYELVQQMQQSEFQWKNYDGCIDLTGCGEEKHTSFDWLVWLQQLIEQGHKEGLVILGVTKGLETYRNTKVNLSGASRAGLYRMLQSEYGHLRSRHMDVDPLTSDIALVQQISSEFFMDTEDPEVCYRDEKRYRAVLVEMEESDASQTVFEFPENHVLWITGGTRGLGYLCADHFVKQYGVKHLVLTGREVLPPREQWDAYEGNNSITHKIRAIQSLESQGVQVQTLSVSLEDKDLLRQALQKIKNSMGPIGGVIHCAGMGDRENPAFIRKSIESIQQVLSPKVDGLETMYQILKDEPLQFFVLYSSVSAIIPSLASGQSDYAMANVYMDYFAEAHSNSCPIISIEWPSWKETGMGEIRSRAYVETGLLSQTNAEGLDFLDYILSKNIRNVILPAVVNPELWKPDELLQRTIQKASLAENIKEQHTIVKSVSKVLDSQIDVTQAWLMSLFSRELKIDCSKIDVDIPFQDYGMDSILLAQVITKMERELNGISVEPSILIENSTLQSLAIYLTQNYQEALAPLASIPDKKEKRTPQILDKQTNQFKVLQRKKGREARKEKANFCRQKIAVVGMACHFPDATNIQEYWDNLRSGKDSIREVPKSRWDWEKYYDPSGYKEGKSISKWGAFLDGIEKFDPDYFKISESLAPQIDPLQRQWLEVSAEALADAGYDKKSLWGKRVGVFAGARAGNFANKLKGAKKDRIVGTGQNFITVHLAHVYNFKGPNMIVDAACASSLAAIHLAVKSIQNGEAEMALAGGVDILLDESAFISLSAEKILSPDGRCKTFNAEANGIGVGEGCGVLILKPLEKAIKDNNKIYGVIDGSAVNCDGNTMGITTPNPEAQKELIKAALDDANINSESISYMETHGTGTLIGDPIELKALTQIFTECTCQKQFCGVGSVKSNMGHLLSAAGVAGIIKVLLAINQQELPPTLHCSNPNPRFKFQDSPLYLVRDLKKWITDTGILRAGVSAFGLGGNNAHIIVSNEGIPNTHKASLERRGNKITFNRKYYWPIELENEKNNQVQEDSNHQEHDEVNELNELFEIEEV